MINFVNLFQDPSEFGREISKLKKINVYLTVTLICTVTLILQQIYDVTYMDEPVRSWATLLSVSVLGGFIFPYIKAYTTHFGLRLMRVNNYEKVFNIAVTSFGLVQIYSIFSYVYVLSGLLNFESWGLYALASVGLLHGYIIEVFGLKTVLKTSWVKAIVAPFLIMSMIFIVLGIILVASMILLGLTLPSLDLTGI